MENALLYQIAFSMVKSMHGDTAIELLRRVGSPEAFFAFTHQQLVSITGVDSKCFSDASRREVLDKAQAELNFCTHNSIEAAFYGTPNFAKRLEDCPDSPILTYKLGRCSLNCSRVVGVVGTRHATPYGIDFAKRLVADLAKHIPGVVIVSGLAYGIDVAAHQAAMEAGTPTIAVLAHGLDTIYPAQHRSTAARIIETGGALLTEYPSNTQIYAPRFLARNRIVAGLCDCLVVVESDFRGGSMSTANVAMQYNRDVFALPGRINDTYSRGTNKLIARNVAALITSAQDILDHMGWKSEVKEEVPDQKQLFLSLRPEQQEIINFVKSHPEATINDMCVGLGVTYSTLSGRLFELEDADLIIQIPGGRYALTTKMK